MVGNFTSTPDRPDILASLSRTTRAPEIDLDGWLSSHPPFFHLKTHHCRR